MPTPIDTLGVETVPARPEVGPFPVPDARNPIGGPTGPQVVLSPVPDAPHPIGAPTGPRVVLSPVPDAPNLIGGPTGPRVVLSPVPDAPNLIGGPTGPRVVPSPVPDATHPIGGPTGPQVVPSPAPDATHPIGAPTSPQVVPSPVPDGLGNGVVRPPVEQPNGAAPARVTGAPSRTVPEPGPPGIVGQQDDTAAPSEDPKTATPAKQELPARPVRPGGGGAPIDAAAGSGLSRTRAGAAPVTLGPEPPVTTVRNDLDFAGPRAKPAILPVPPSTPRSTVTAPVDPFLQAASESSAAVRPEPWTGLIREPSPLAKAPDAAPSPVVGGESAPTERETFGPLPRAYDAPPAPGRTPTPAFSSAPSASAVPVEVTPPGAERTPAGTAPAGEPVAQVRQAPTFAKPLVAETTETAPPVPDIPPSTQPTVSETRRSVPRPVSTVQVASPTLGPTTVPDEISGEPKVVAQATSTIETPHETSRREVPPAEAGSFGDAATRDDADAPLRQNATPTQDIQRPAGAERPSSTTAVPTGIEATSAAAPRAARADGPAPPPSIRHEALAETILARATQMPKPGRVELRFVLSPPDLGHVRINIEASGDQLRVELLAPSQQAADVLQSGLSRLGSHLNNAGFPQVELNLGLADSADSGLQAGDGHGDERRSSTPRRSDRSMPDEDPAETTESRDSRERRLDRFA
ncbi:MAG: hypothetical protein GY716_08565 [bacterium]|nr:hypothetical protein [bacterium]